MNHPSEDQLLQYSLTLLDEQERQAVEQHLALCDSCRSCLNEIGQDVSRLSSLRIPSSAEYPPFGVRRSSFVAASWLRIAAVLLLGFLGGFATSRVIQPELIVVRPMPKLAMVAPVDSGKALATKEDALRVFSASR